MTIRWIEGYEARLHETLQGETYGQDGTGGYNGVAAGGAGAGGRKIGTSMRVSDFARFTTPKLVASPTNTWIVQFALRKAASSTIAGSPGFGFFKEANGQQMEVRIVDGGRPGTYALEAFRDTTSLGVTKDFAYGGNRTWMCFHIKVVISTTVGEVNIKAFDYYNNAETVMNLTGQNTEFQASAGMDQVAWALNSQLDTIEYFDDIVIMDDAGSVNNAQTSVPFLVYGALPSADGATTDWDPSTGANHAVLLNSASTLAGNNEEVTSDTVTNLDQFDFNDISEMSNAGTPAIAAMMVDIHGAMKNSGTRTLRVNVNDPLGSDSDVATDLVFSDLVLTARTLIMENNPVSAAVWTLADLEDHQIGFKLQA